MHTRNSEDMIDIVGCKQLDERFAAAALGGYNAPARLLATASGRT
jgi:hypothetical protein